MTDKVGFSVWLIPEDEQCCQLQSIISKLSDRFNAPDFIPHVTIYCGEVESLDKVKDVLDSFVQQALPITLDVKGMNATERLFQTLFVTFDENAALKDLYAKIANGLPHSGDDQLKAHLSLLYKDMPLEEKKALIDEIDLSLSRIKFDKIDLIHEEDADIVSSWHCAHRFK